MTKMTRDGSPRITPTIARRLAKSISLPPRFRRRLFCTALYAFLVGLSAPVPVPVVCAFRRPSSLVLHITLNVPRPQEGKGRFGVRRVSMSVMMPNELRRPASRCTVRLGVRHSRRLVFRRADGKVPPPPTEVGSAVRRPDVDATDAADDM